MSKNIYIGFAANFHLPRCEPASVFKVIITRRAGLAATEGGGVHRKSYLGVSRGTNGVSRSLARPRLWRSAHVAYQAGGGGGRSTEKVILAPRSGRARTPLFPPTRPDSLGNAQRNWAMRKGKLRAPDYLLDY